MIAVLCFAGLVVLIYAIDPLANVCAWIARKVKW
jgi:hypothetical protein